MAAVYVWFLVLGSVLVCNLIKTLLPAISSFLSKVFQKDAAQEMEMRMEIQGMKQELASISMMDEFARYARLERKINKTTDKLKTHVKSRTAQQAKIKWVVNIVYYVLQTFSGYMLLVCCFQLYHFPEFTQNSQQLEAALMISLIWKYYADPVTVLPSKWIAPLERLVAFPSGSSGGVGITTWLVVCNKVVAIILRAVG